MREIMKVLKGALVQAKKFPVYFWAGPGVFVVVFFVALFGLTRFIPHENTNPQDTKAFAKLFIEIFLIVFISSSVLLSIFYLYITRIAIQVMSDQPESILSSLIVALKRFPRLIWKAIELIPLFFALAIAFFIVVAMIASGSSVLIKLFIKTPEINGGVMVAVMLVAFFIFAILVNPLIQSFMNLLVIHVCNHEKKEIRKSFSYLQNNFSFFYKFYLLAMLAIILIAVILYIPYFTEFFQHAGRAAREFPPVNNSTTSSGKTIMGGFYLVLAFAVQVVSFYGYYLIQAVTVRYYLTHPETQKSAGEEF